jgi:glycosyltransferase involved in cell wall biosynthesis
MPLKVLFHCRSTFHQLHGGDSVQIQSTKIELEHRGVIVDISTDASPDPRGYDICHVFNPVVVSMRGAQRARQAQIPVVISTIFWPMRDWFRSYLVLAILLTRFMPKGWRHHAVDALVRFFAYTYLRNPVIERRLQRFLSLADVLLPNSEAEGQILATHLGIKKPWRAVPNGVGTAIDTNQPLPRAIEEFGDYVLCVGRLEPRKNQHLLIQKLIGTDLPLLFVGRPLSIAGYEQLCLTLGRRRGQTSFLGHVAHESLPAIYCHARVHALPSWHETPGLASLEAAAYGCAIVTTTEGGTKEYFGTEAFYCSPAEPDSIREAVLAAYQSGRPIRLAARIRREFTWAVAAAKTIDAYRHVLRTG